MLHMHVYTVFVAFLTVLLLFQLLHIICSSLGIIFLYLFYSRGFLLGTNINIIMIFSIRLIVALKTYCT